MRKIRGLPANENVKLSLTARLLVKIYEPKFTLLQVEKILPLSYGLLRVVETFLWNKNEVVLIW